MMGHVVALVRERVQACKMLLLISAVVLAQVNAMIGALE
jgi:hypothetical protein